MSQSKFRSWNKEEGKFYYFSKGRYYKDAELKKCVSERICLEFSWNNAEQFTGLHDKNGVDIYEGDILSKVSISELGSLIQYFYLVFWSSSDQGFKTKQYVLDENNKGLYWRIKNEGVFDSLVMAKTYNHVIGNIHQNPEILK